MFTKFDKNFANYLDKNLAIYHNNLAIYHNHSNINGPQGVINDNDRNVLENEQNTENEHLKYLEEEEDDSVINSLPDMNELENYENSQNGNHPQFEVNNSNNFKYMCGTGQGEKHQMISPLPLSPVSSIGSSVSSSFNPLHHSTGSSSNVNEIPSKRLFNRNIHCVKEKIRRDRIKYSCNELRRLIPNLNGVKTDMASLLETSVLWIQLINSHIPEKMLVNVQNKLESIKIFRQQQNSNSNSINGSKQCQKLPTSSSSHNIPHNNNSKTNNSTNSTCDSSSSLSSNNQSITQSPIKKIRKKNVCENVEINNLKQEIHKNKDNNNSKVQINNNNQSLSSSTSSSGSSYMSSLDTTNSCDSPTNVTGSAGSVGISNNNQTILPNFHHAAAAVAASNFMSKPSKWLSIQNQQKSIYSDALYNAQNRNHGMFGQSGQLLGGSENDSIQSMSDSVQQRCFINVNNPNYSELDFLSKMSKKCVDFNNNNSNNNNLFLGQIYDQQGNCGNYCQNQVTDSPEASNITNSVYFQN